MGVHRLAITGLQTEFCVDATARAALSRGYEVSLVADAHTTGDAVMSAEIIIRHHNYALGNLAHPKLSIKVTDSADMQFTWRSTTCGGHAASPAHQPLAQAHWKL